MAGAGNTFADFGMIVPCPSDRLPRSYLASPHHSGHLPILPSPASARISAAKSPATFSRSCVHRDARSTCVTSLQVLLDGSQLFRLEKSILSQLLVLDQFVQHPRGAGFLRPQPFQVKGQIARQRHCQLALGHVAVVIRHVVRQVRQYLGSVHVPDRFPHGVDRCQTGSAQPSS